jgi:hypothetical protein
MARKPRYTNTDKINAWLYKKYWEAMYETCSKMELEREKRCKAENEKYIALQKQNADK